MTVKEFIDVVNPGLIDYARIVEMYWDDEWQEYCWKDTEKRVDSVKNLEPYYNCELSKFQYDTMYAEYDDSAIYIKMPKEVI